MKNALIYEKSVHIHAIHTVVSSEAKNVKTFIAGCMYNLKWSMHALNELLARIQTF